MSATITSYNMEFPLILENPMTTKDTNSIWDKCRMSAVVEPVSQEKMEQIKQLKMYLIEFLETHLKYLPEVYNTEHYRNFIKKIYNKITNPKTCRKVWNIREKILKNYINNLKGGSHTAQLKELEWADIENPSKIFNKPLYLYYFLGDGKSKNLYRVLN